MDNRIKIEIETTPPEPDIASAHQKLTQLNKEMFDESGIALLNYLTECFAKHPILPTHLASNYNSESSHAHARIGYDPATLTTYDIVTGLTSPPYKSSPIVFIKADKPLPGNAKPSAAARTHLYLDEKVQNATIEDPKGKSFVVCYGHGGLASLGSLQTDHVTSASDILAKQMELVRLLNENKDISKIFIKELQLQDFFVLTPTGYQGTLYFYERYYNDIENLWNICQHCNLKKSNNDSYEWFQKNPNFGDKFIASLNLQDTTPSGFINNQNGVGLAKVALEWYREHHAATISATLKLHKSVVFKIEENLEKAREAVANDNLAKANQYNTKAKFDTQVASLIVSTKYNIESSQLTPVSSPGASQGMSDDDQQKKVSIEDIKLMAEQLETQSTARAKVRKYVRTKLYGLLDPEISTESDDELSSYTSQEKIDFHQSQIERLETKIDYHKSEIERIKATLSSASLQVTSSSTQFIQEGESGQIKITNLKRRSIFTPAETSPSSTTTKKLKIKNPSTSESTSKKKDKDEKPDTPEDGKQLKYS